MRNFATLNRSLLRIRPRRTSANSAVLLVPSVTSRMRTFAAFEKYMPSCDGNLPSETVPSLEFACVPKVISGSWVRV